MPTRRTAVTASLATVVALSLTACGQGGSNAGGGGAHYPTEITLADRDSADDLHPASGYGQTGVSPVYDGLMRPRPVDGDNAIPTIVPALAASEPTHNAKGDEWTVTLRKGVKFHDGSDVDAADVKATYDTAVDATWGSKIVNRYNLISRVDVVDAHTVKFTLRYPYAGFQSRLTLAIAPSEVVSQGSAAKNPLGEKPVGTGPYKVTALTKERVVYEANDAYWGGAPQVKKMTVVTTSDDSARGQRVAAGEIDGAALPAGLAASFKGKDGVQMHSVKTADFRGVSLPDLPVLADPKVRVAINKATDRAAMTSSTLHGLATPIETPLWGIYGDAHDPKATFGHDPAGAGALLDQAGWTVGPDGIRVKDGQRFSVPMMYAADDSLRRDLAVEFSGQMKKLGLEFKLEGGTWDKMTPQLGQKACLLGGGSAPYDPDLMIYGELHSRTKDSTPYNNPGNHGSPAMDALLDAARREMNDQKRGQAYRAVAQEYVKNPNFVYLAAVNHNYVSKPNGWNRDGVILEPHVHGATWGPWWNLAAWTK